MPTPRIFVIRVALWSLNPARVVDCSGVLLSLPIHVCCTNPFGDYREGMPNVEAVQIQRPNPAQAAKTQETDVIGSYFGKLPEKSRKMGMHYGMHLRQVHLFHYEK